MARLLSTPWLRRTCWALGLLLLALGIWRGQQLLNRPRRPDGEPARSLVGRVVDEHDRGVPQARVRIKGHEPLVTTDPEGNFHLPWPAAVGEEDLPTVTAAKPGYLIAGIALEAAADGRPLRIQLTALPVDDCLDYRWVDPRPNASAEHHCGNCHDEIFNEWQSGAHARSASGRKFLNLYGGTDWHGRPGHGWSLLDEHPTGAGVCTACHAPTVAFDDDAYHDLRQASGASAQGVHCDYCHKVQDVAAEKFGLTHGRFAQRLRRPANGQLFFGPLDDVDRGEDAYSPLQKDSRFCGACHEGTIFGVHVYGTYSEWLASPARTAGKQCQDCHMTPTGRMTNVAPAAGGIERDPRTLASHDFLPGGKAAMLRRSLAVSVAPQATADAWHVQVEIVAQDVGHRVPTGFIDRHLLLAVDALDDDDREQPLKAGPVLPWASGGLAGQPGQLFGKLLTDTSGRGPIPFWQPAAEPIDTRLRPEQPWQTTFIFPTSASRVRVRLLYRPFWESVAREKDWPSDEIVVYDRTVELRR